MTPAAIRALAKLENWPVLPCPNCGGIWWELRFGSHLGQGRGAACRQCALFRSSGWLDARNLVVGTWWDLRGYAMYYHSEAEAERVHQWLRARSVPHG